MKTTILFPSDFFNIKRVDADYEEEYKAVAQLSAFDILLYNYDEFVKDSRLKFYPSAKNNGKCIYRGWMLKPEEYLKLYMALQDNGIQLINTPEEYNQIHIFPNIYGSIQRHTPKILFCEDFKSIDWTKINAEFERFMIKDYVKSVKGTDFPTHFKTPVDKEEMENYIEKFIKLRDNLFTGGIVIKEYVDLKRYSDTTNEYRVFYLNGRIVTISKNSNQPESCPVLPYEYAEQFSKLGSNYYTVDFAECDNGTWVILETGDGQVSGLSPNQYVFKYYDEIRYILSNHCGG